MNEEVWIIDDDRSIRWVLERALEKADINTRSFENAEAAVTALNGNTPTTIVTDVRMPGMNGLEFLNYAHEKYPDLPIIIMTAHSDLDSAVQSFQKGAFEYLAKPFDVDEAVSVVKRAITFAQTNATETPPADAGSDGSLANAEIIGQAPAMQEVFRAIGRLAASHVTVLVNGASGSGKELVARALHKHSPRASAPFVALNMAAIPSELIESELFGHEKGAFSGAVAKRMGRFEQANNGTLFLDEIGDMPASAQTRLLRVLSEGEFFRVGGHEPVRVNVRIIAATHQDLETLVKKGDFREDLFHRLNVIRVHVPTLAERRTDIPLLANHFLRSAANELGVEPKHLSDAAEKRMLQLPWPGNVRQLENTCRWLTVMAPGQEVQVDDFPTELRDAEASSPATEQTTDWEGALAHWADQHFEATPEIPLLDLAQPTFERTVILAALRHTGGRKKDAAKALGWGRNTLTRKMSELNME